MKLNIPTITDIIMAASDDIAQAGKAVISSTIVFLFIGWFCQNKKYFSKASNGGTKPP